MKYLTAVLLLISVYRLHGQTAPGTANMTSSIGNTGSESKQSSLPLDLYTGMPTVSVPIYNYGNAASGLSWPVSLSYYAGGIQVGEAASTVGLGWNFNASGAITRTVRGMPDDIPTNGYLYSAAIPTDYRSNGNKYATDSLDPQQDVFQFNFKGRSGQFLIGKNKQIVQIPNTKMRISYTVSSSDHSSITNFRVITEDGTTYDFATEETTVLTQNASFAFGYSGITYGSAWWLTDVIAPFNTDTIRFNYVAISINTTQSFPQYADQFDPDGTPHVVSPSASVAINSYKLSSIVFPDKKSLQVVYSNVVTYAYGDPAVSKIKICDSIFRFGFALEYRSGNNFLFLKKVTPYTAYQEQDGYSFNYADIYNPLAPADFYQTDFWGFYNGASTNQNLIPQQGSNTHEAIRTPNITYAVFNALTQYRTPGGGYIGYNYELNDCYPLTKTSNSLTVDGTASGTQASASFTQVFGTRQLVTMNLDPIISRIGTPPISGGGSITLAIKSTDLLTTYATITFSLYDLFYLGTKNWQFNIPNGSYQLTSSLSGGTSFSGGFPINVTWENRTVDNTKSAITSGGLRVKRITYSGAVDDPFFYQDIQYLTEDGKSSGVFGDLPSFVYPYSEAVYNGSTVTTTSYTLINSNPINTQDYSQGGAVGYSRVLVYKGTSSHNLGKTIYEYTGPTDVNCNISTRVLPYTVPDYRSWGLGLPKRTSIYDSSGRLVQRSVTRYGMDTIAFTSSDFLSLQLGNTSTYVYNNPGNPPVYKTPLFIGQQYYPSSGRVFVTSTADTLYQMDSSINTTYKNLFYDSNFNISKEVASYDRTRGLQLETRYYYPYNYIIGGAIDTLRTHGILGPVIASENWITGDGNPRIVGGTITDYHQLAAGYIKPYMSYSLQTSAPLPQGTIGLFDSSRLNRNNTYFVAQASYPSYSSKGNLLQATNVLTGVSSAIVRDYNDEYPVASVTNAALADIAYTSFESDGSGSWTVGSPIREMSTAVTGKIAYNLSNGNVFRSGLTSSATYIISVWAFASANVQINGTSQTSPLASQNGWNFYFTTVTGVTSVTVSGSGIIDELRLYPKDANMATTTYEPLVGATSVCDKNNTIVYTSYDLLGRTKLIRDKDQYIVKRYDYADKDSLISVAPLWVRSSAFQWDPSFTCGFDSIIVVADENPWSDTYNQSSTTVIFQGYNYCSCSLSANYPMWKTIGGVCKQAIKQFESCTFKAGVGYICFYHYVWPDCSISSTQVETDATAQTVTSGCPIFP
jgi:hypothetical protein